MEPFACLSGFILFKQFSGNPSDNPLPQPLPWAPAIKLSGRFAILIKNLIFHYLFNQVFELKLLRVCTFLLLDLDLQTQLRDLEPLAELLVLGLLSRHYLHTGLSRERIRWSGLERRNKSCCDSQWKVANCLECDGKGVGWCGLILIMLTIRKMISARLLQHRAVSRPCRVGGFNTNTPSSGWDLIPWLEHF